MCNKIKYLKLAEVQYTIFTFFCVCVQLNVISENQRVSRMWKNAYVAVKIVLVSEADPATG